MKIEIEEDELRDLYLLMEEMNDLFHQRMHYENSEVVSNFAAKNYPKIRRMYYETLWSCLPEEFKTGILER